MPERRIQCSRCGISQVEVGSQANLSDLLDLARRIGWTVVHRQHDGFDVYCSRQCFEPTPTPTPTPTPNVVEAVPEPESGDDGAKDPAES